MRETPSNRTMSGSGTGVLALESQGGCREEMQPWTQTAAQTSAQEIIENVMLWYPNEFKVNVSMAIHLKKGLLVTLNIETHNGSYDKRSFHSSFLILALYTVYPLKPFVQFVIQCDTRFQGI